MSAGAKQRKGEKKNVEETERKCTHEYCHRDEIESDKPIGLPWASGRLKHLPGQEPTDIDPKAEEIKIRLKMLKENFLAIPEACPPIKENISVRKDIESDVNYLFNFISEVGKQDVEEYITKYKEEKEKSKEEEKEKSKEEEKVKSKEETSDRTKKKQAAKESKDKETSPVKGAKKK
uniref:Uncharacterized protein n=1 Tax=Rhodnius prolixus TaxID=13249 RepID=T1I5M9_RHOPR